MSDTLRRSLKGILPALLLLLAAALPAGCRLSDPKPVLDAAEESLLSSKGDTALGRAVREGGKDPFAVIAVFRGDIFIGHSTMLDRSSLTMLNEFGNAALLLLRPNEVLPLLKSPSITRIAWFGPQGRLARLEPTLEFDLLDRFGKGTEGRDVPILARFRSVPEKKEDMQVESAGFRIVSRAGPSLSISGPMSGIPQLLSIDWIIYLEKESGR